MDRYYSSEELEFQKHFFSALSALQFHVIPSETRFWMLRTQRGYFYNEFVTEKFVALAWNIIDSSTSMSKENIDRLKPVLVAKYENTGRPMTAINKCNSFINEVKVGDYILIPSEGTKYITIALAGEYYEEDGCTYEIEHETIEKIRNNSATVTEVTCPYKKRRKITPLITLPSSKLHYRLYRAISNYHGISNLDDYAHQILSAVYKTYSFGPTSVITLWSAQTDPIGPRALSGLLFYSTNYLCRLTNEENLSTKVNLNSEGPIQFILQQLQGEYPTLVTVFLIVAGIGCVAANCEKIPDLVKGLLSIPAELYEKYTAALHKRKELKGQDKSVALDQELKQIEIMEKKVDLIEKIKASGIDPKALETDLVGIAQSAFEMKVTPAIELPPSPAPNADASDTPNTDNETSSDQADT